MGDNHGDFHLDVMVTGLVEIANMLIRLLISVILARSLGAEGRGVYALALAAPGLLLNFTSIGLGEATTVLLGKQKYSRDRIIGSMNLMLVVMALAGFAVYFGFSSLILKALRFNIPPGLYLLSFFIFPLTLFWGGNASAALGLSMVRKLAWGRFLNNFFFLALVSLTSFYGASVSRVVAVFILASLLENAYLLYFIGRRSKISVCFDPAVIKDQLSIGWRYFWGGIFLQVTRRLDIFLVNFFMGAGPLGVYAVAFSVAEFVLTVPSVYSRAAFSASAASREQEGFSVSNAAVRQTLFLMMFFSLALAVVLKPLIIRLYTAEFLSAVTPALILIPGVIMLGFSTLMGYIFTGYGRPQEITRAAAVSCAATVVLDLVLIPKYGLNGAAAASAAAYSLGALYFLRAYLEFARVPVSEILVIRRNDFEAYREKFSRILDD